jgi:hypothetical protein
VWLHLVDKMAGELARLLAVLDRNCGLEHLRPDQPAWMPQLFVNMLRHVDLDSPPTISHIFRFRFDFGTNRVGNFVCDIKNLFSVRSWLLQFHHTVMIFMYRSIPLCTVQFAVDF